jgi:exonuclease III
MMNLLKLFFSFGLVLGLVSSSDTQCPYISNSTNHDNRTNKDKLRLVQHNIEWMFYDYYPNSNCPGSGCVWANQSEVQIHMDYISKIINDLNPDIINFCEIEGCDELEMIKSRTNPSYNPYLIKGTDSATGQNVGMLTLLDPVVNLYRTETKYSYPIPNSRCNYTGTGSSGVSKHYITKFDLNNLKVAMIAAHLLAIPTDPYRCSAREAQAQVLQEQIASLVTGGYEVIMLGDLNDYDNLIPDANQNYPTSQVLDILKGNTGLYKSQYELKSIGDKIPQSQRYSEYWDENSDCVVQSNEFSMIDHILLTPKLYGFVTNAFAYHAYPHSCDGNSYNSDHDPVVIDFEF